jgi:hypothetical protein
LLKIEKFVCPRSSSPYSLLNFGDKFQSKSFPVKHIPTHKHRCHCEGKLILRATSTRWCGYGQYAHINSLGEYLKVNTISINTWIISSPIDIGYALINIPGSFKAI